MKRAFAALLLTTTGILACGRLVATPQSEPVLTLTHDGLERSYILHLPPSSNEGQSLPLVLAFHGGGGNAENQLRLSGLNQPADEQGFIVVYPNGTGRLDDKLLTWNGSGCCGYAQEQDIDDVGFIRALVSELGSEFDIDPKRIYATGLSNGGILSYRLACEASDLFAAIAPVAGTQMEADCQPTQPVSIIHFHGTDDEHLPYDGGLGEKSLTGINYTSVPDSLAFWIRHDQCPSRADPVQDQDVIHFSYAPCDQGTAVELYKIVGGKHAWPGSDGPAWPGGDQPTQTISATELMWDFFAAHPKP